MGFRFSASVGLLALLLFCSLGAPVGRSELAATCTPNDVAGELGTDHVKPADATQTDAVTGFDQIDIASACIQEDATTLSFTFVLTKTPAPNAAQTWSYKASFQDGADKAVTCTDVIGATSPGVTPPCTAALVGSAIQVKFVRSTLGGTGGVIHDLKFHTGGVFITPTGAVLTSSDDAPNTGTLFPKTAPYIIGTRAPSTLDSDMDGVPDKAEIANGTDPKSFDSDHDGLLDGANVDVPSSSGNATNYTKAGILKLGDDGTTARFAGEAAFGTNATKPDTDGDGILDGANVTAPTGGNVSRGFAAFGLTPASSDGSTDTFLGEFPFGTDPTKIDTDEEGVQDVDEITGARNQQYSNESFFPGMPGSTNPKVADTDADGLNDEEEISGSAVVGGQTLTFSPTNPNLADTDGDGLTDKEEITGVTQDGKTFPPTDPTKADTDGDGAGDNSEVQANTNPTDPHDAPKAGTTTEGGGDVSYLLLSAIAMLVVGLLCIVGIMVRWG